MNYDLYFISLNYPLQFLKIVYQYFNLLPPYQLESEAVQTEFEFCFAVEILMQTLCYFLLEKMILCHPFTLQNLIIIQFKNLLLLV